MADELESGRKLRTKQRKKYNDQDIDEDDIDGRRLYSVEEKLLSDQFDSDMVQELKGPDFTMEWLQKNGLTRPIVFYDKTGLGLRVPSENFKVSDVKQCVGSRRVLDVMDVSTQKALEMSMKEWAKYYENPDRDRLLNVISLEFCHTRLENYVESPTLVRQIDWVDRAWPRHLKECQTESTNVIERMKYPKVQKYCLMSVAGCYTDFHIDFGGTSVWYHILHGEKIFWLAPPSQKNIDRYVEWTLSAKQGESFLGDSLECCQRIQLREGYTFIIPSGWIHAVYTPKDSLVFGGNFLHSFNVENQLLVSRIEDKTYVPSKFKYPFYQEIMWYVVDRYLSCLTGHTYLAPTSGDKDESYEDDDQGLIHVDEDSRPPSRNPDSRPPSRAMDEIKPEKEEETPKISKSVTIELTRIDAAAMKRSPSEDENQPPASAQGRPRGPRKAASDPNNSWEGGGAKKWIYLTATELKGANQLVDYLSGLMALPVSKRGIPKDMLDPEALLKELRQVLDEHKTDDQSLSITGEPVIGWPELARKKQKLKLGYKTYKTPKAARGGQTTPQSSSSNVQRRRRTRCKKCEACTRTECGECTFCKDMKKFGGPGRMKQTCISRQCMAPILPSASVCILCNQGDQSNTDDPDDISSSLMECGICWEIVHPKCLRKKYENLDSEGVVNEDLPNSWECLKCCNEGRQGQLKARPKPGFSTKKTRTEDSEGSQEEDGGGPLSPRSPVEGKRVTAKEGGMKCEFGTPIKWSNSSKRYSPMSESNIKKEGDSRSRASPLPHFGDENVLRKASSYSPGLTKEQKKMIKREKSPTSNQAYEEEVGRGARKRHTQEQETGSKRPKREIRTPREQESPASAKAQNASSKSPQSQTQQKKLKSKDDHSENKQSKTSSQKRKKKVVVKEPDPLPSEPLKSCVKNKELQATPIPAKIRKCVSFEESVENPAVLEHEGRTSENPVVFEHEGRTSENPVVFEQEVRASESSDNGTPSTGFCPSDAPDTLPKGTLENEQNLCPSSKRPDGAKNSACQDKTAALQSRRFDPVRGYRPGKKPMYRGNADWSKEFKPPKESKSLRTLSVGGISGLTPRPTSEAVGEREGQLHGKTSGSPSSLSLSSGGESLSKFLSSRTHPESISAAAAAATGSGLPQAPSAVDVTANLPAVGAVASMTPALSHTSPDSEKADVGSAPEMSEPAAVSTSADKCHDESTVGTQEASNVESSTVGANTHVASVLAQKLRDAFRSKSAQPQKILVVHQEVHEPPSSPAISIKKDKPPTPSAAVPVQRIIVRDCSSTPSLVSKVGHINPSSNPRVQTVIVRRLSSDQTSLTTKSAENPLDLLSTADQPEKPTSPPMTTQSTHVKPEIQEARPGCNSDSSGSVVKTVETDILSAGENKSDNIPSKSSGNLFDNMFDLERTKAVTSRMATALKPGGSSCVAAAVKLEEASNNNEQQAEQAGSLQNGKSSVSNMEGKAGFDNCENPTFMLNGVKIEASEERQNSFLIDTRQIKQERDEKRVSKLPDLRLVTSRPLGNTELQTPGDNTQQDSGGPDKDKDSVTSVSVGSPVGNYQPLLFDHPYCQGCGVPASDNDSVVGV